MKRNAVVIPAFRDVAVLKIDKRKRSFRQSDKIGDGSWRFQELQAAREFTHRVATPRDLKRGVQAVFSRRGVHRNRKNQPGTQKKW
jgi:hypothetical protein